MGEVKPQDATSGLVARSWERRHRKDKIGVQVEATFLDRRGHLRRAAGSVSRNDAGELVVESWADGVQQQTPVTRDATVDVTGRKR